MKLAWASDIHLNFADDSQQRWFLHNAKERADALVISGDIGESETLHRTLKRISNIFEKPVYFVLGNHDFYRGSIERTKRTASRCAYTTQNMFYLSNNPTIELSPTTAMVGHDGWADGRFGNFDDSDVILNDFILIEELSFYQNGELDKEAMRPVLEKLGDEAARYISLALFSAAHKYKKVYVVTHVPPFCEATWHNGQQSDDNFLPYFSCKAMGDAILKVANEYPKCQIVVLCGHTHSSGEVTITPNLQVLTAPGKYGHPEIYRTFNVQ
jgi:Icc-related predicted phosphoesterase